MSNPPTLRKPTNTNNIIELFSGKSSINSSQRIIRLSPEYEGLTMLYSNAKTNSETLYSMKILCWGIREDGKVVGMVPWLNKVIACEDLQDPTSGLYEGYYDVISEEVFYQAPPHKAVELEAAVNYFDSSSLVKIRDSFIQEIPDIIGTHAMLNAEDSCSIILTEVISWRLLENGKIEAMLVNDQIAETTPVLPGDDCLYSASNSTNFRYFFQHHIANQIKAEDPEALAAISLLFE
jgi:hypothetical protein